MLEMLIRLILVFGTTAVLLTRFVVLFANLLCSTGCRKMVKLKKCELENDRRRNRRERSKLLAQRCTVVLQNPKKTEHHTDGSSSKSEMVLKMVLVTIP